MKINNINNTTFAFVERIYESVSLAIEIFEDFHKYCSNYIENVDAINLITKYIENDADEIDKLRKSKPSIKVYGETAAVVQDAIKSLDKESIETLEKWQRLNSAQSYAELKAAITDIDNSVILNISSELSNIIKWSIDHIYDDDNNTKRVKMTTIEIIEEPTVN